MSKRKGWKLRSSVLRLHSLLTSLANLHQNRVVLFIFSFLTFSFSPALGEQPSASCPLLAAIVSAKQTAALASDKFRAATYHTGCELVSRAVLAFLLDSAFSSHKTQIQGWPESSMSSCSVLALQKRGVDSVDLHRTQVLWMSAFTSLRAWRS